METAKSIFGFDCEKVLHTAQHEIAFLMRYVNDGGKVDAWESSDESISIERA